jgi:viroplasmin and RNaseH domain-containing protein
VYGTQEDCSKMVTGYRGAEFKSFWSLPEAKRYLGLHRVVRALS